MNQRPFEDLTLTELIGQFVRDPIKTFRLFRAVIAPTRRSRNIAMSSVYVEVSPRATPMVRSPEQAVTIAHILRVVFYMAAFVIGVIGAFQPVNDRTLRIDQFSYSTLCLFGALGVIVIAETVRRRGAVTPKSDAETAFSATHQAHPIRWGALGITAMLMGGAFLFNGQNPIIDNSDHRFTPLGVIFWWSSIGLGLYAFAPQDWNLFSSLNQKWGRLNGWLKNERWIVYALVAIVLIGGVFRLQYLDQSPPDMTSDHVEKLMDAQRVADGQWDVFMANNGGREPLHFYLLAMMSHLPGVSLEFMTLKTLSAIESLFTIVVMFWLGREIIGARNPRLATLLGLALALAVAIGYWHLMVTRVSLRITLTPLFSALLMIYLLRIVRHNRRGDYLKAGLILGVSLYAYQAARMFPVMVIASAALALIFQIRERRVFALYFSNYVILALIALIVFVPLMRYAIEEPDSFWSRTSGRLLGEDVITTTNELGQVVERQATAQDRLDAFGRNAAIFGQNLINAAGTFHYQGDVIFLHNASRMPALDPFLGSLMMLGAGGWIVWMIRRRDVGDWLIPVGMVVMMLPSALAIAAPNENPSFTRMSGALPMVFFLVAFGMTLIAYPLWQAFRNRTGLIGIGISALLLVWVVYSYVSPLIFVRYRGEYFNSWHPISTGGQIMRGFADSGGAFGNTFILTYRYWWDYRGIAIEAGLPPGKWPNGDIQINALPRRMRDLYTSPGRYPLDPERDLLIFYHREDLQAEELLQLWFPEGRSTLIEVFLPPLEDQTLPGLARPDENFKIYRVPALGSERFAAFIQQYAN
ncbi:MAG: glycosyltransferase family 39 protein [Anaerolineae bacterium]|jgi:hypothetical protein|nr:glycosyltransferase family 39 protein [Anaerolineae bacterium]